MNAEQVVYEAVLMGELRIDRDGTIWRVAARRADRWRGGSRTIPCKPRRAENATGLGYLQVRSMIDGKRHYALAHRLVYLHFKGPIPHGLTVNHLNGKRADNRPENLDLATASEQMLHAIRDLGLRPEKNFRRSVG